MLAVMGVFCAAIVPLRVFSSANAREARRRVLSICVWGSILLGGVLSVARRMESPFAESLEIGGTAIILTCVLFQVLLARIVRLRLISIPLLALIVALLQVFFLVSAGTEMHDHMAALVGLAFLPGIALVIWLAGVDPDTLLGMAKRAAMIIGFGSLGLALVAPGLAFGDGYSDMRRVSIGGLTARLSGMAPHPNFLGVIAAIGLALSLSKTGWIRWALTGGYLGVIVLSESRTALLGLALGLSIHWVRSVRDSALRGVLVLVFLVITLAIGLRVIMEDAGSLSLDANGDGRARVWGLVWQEFVRRPLDGYGPFAFSSSGASPFSGSGLLHAHNAVFQAAAETGLLGVISVVLLLLIATRSLLRGDGRHGEFVVSGIVLVGVFTEPLLSLHLYGFNFAVVPVLLYLMVVRASQLEELSSDEGLGKLNENRVGEQRREQRSYRRPNLSTSSSCTPRYTRLARAKR